MFVEQLPLNAFLSHVEHVVSLCARFLRLFCQRQAQADVQTDRSPGACCHVELYVT